MRKIQLALRLRFEAGLSLRAIARTLNVSPATVGEFLRRARLAGLSWPLPSGVNEPGLEARLFPPTALARGPRPLPDWATLHRELKRKGITLALLWQEYKTVYPEGVQYTQFCERYTWCLSSGNRSSESLSIRRFALCIDANRSRYG